MALIPVPTLDFYRRDDCGMCDDARRALQALMEERARRGSPNPRVRYVNVSGRPELEERYGARVPVIAVGADEISLVTSGRAIAVFLDRVMGQLV